MKSFIESLGYQLDYYACRKYYQNKPLMMNVAKLMRCDIWIFLAHRYRKDYVFQMR